MELVEIAERPGPGDPDMESWISPLRGTMGRALAYMRLHSHRRLPLAEVAAVAHMSQCHFSRSFHRIVGVTFQDHLVRLRLRDAEGMLRRDPLAPLRRVAAETGFGTLRNLQDHYGRVYGYPPSRGRAQASQDMAVRDAEQGPTALDHGIPNRRHRGQWIAVRPHGPSEGGLRGGQAMRIAR